MEYKYKAHNGPEDVFCKEISSKQDARCFLPFGICDNSHSHNSLEKCGNVVKPKVHVYIPTRLLVI